MLISSIYIILRSQELRMPQIHEESNDVDIQIPSETSPIVAKACPNSYTTFCCWKGKRCQSVRLWVIQNQGLETEKKPNKAVIKPCMHVDVEPDTYPKSAMTMLILSCDFLSCRMCKSYVIRDYPIK